MGRELFAMWGNTRMVVLTALTGALYAAVLIPFKIATLVPGFTEVRPGVAVPLVFGLLFGPAAAWGSGIGNVIGDFLGGTLSLGSLFGFAGNFLFALTPYKLLGAIDPGSARGEAAWRATARFAFAALPASAVCAATIGWGVERLGFVPFAVLGPIIFLNNLLVGVVLGPVLLRLLLPRVAAWHLLWGDVMEVGAPPAGARVRLGRALIWVGALGALGIGLAAKLGLAGVPLVQAGIPPFLLAFVAGALLS